MEPLLISIRQAAEVLGVGRSTVYDLIDRGAVHTKTIGRRRLVLVTSLRELAGDRSGD